MFQPSLQSELLQKDERGSHSPHVKTCWSELRWLLPASSLPHGTCVPSWGPWDGWRAGWADCEGLASTCVQGTAAGEGAVWLAPAGGAWSAGGREVWPLSSACSFRAEIPGLDNCSSGGSPPLWAQAEGKKSPVLLQNLPRTVWHMPLGNQKHTFSTRY